MARQSDMGDGSSRLREAIGDESFLRVANARRAAWTGGGTGLISGLFLGYGIASLAETYRHRTAVTTPGSRRNGPTALDLIRAARNRAAVAAMAMGASFSFLGAIANGSPQFNSLGDIWESVLPRSGNARILEARDAVRDAEINERTQLIKVLDERAAARSARILAAEGLGGGTTPTT